MRRAAPMGAAMAAVVAAMFAAYAWLVKGPLLPAGFAAALVLAYVAVKSGDPAWAASLATVNAGAVSRALAVLLLVSAAFFLCPAPRGLGGQVLFLMARFLGLYVFSGLGLALLLGTRRLEAALMLAHPLSMALAASLTLVYLGLGVNASAAALLAVALLLLRSRRELGDIAYSVPRIDVAVMLATALLPATYMVVAGRSLPFMAEDTQRDIYYSLRAALGFRELSPLNPHWYIYSPVLGGLVKAAPLTIYPALLLTALQLSSLYFVLLHYVDREAAAAAYVLVLTGMSVPLLASIAASGDLYLPTASSPHLPFSYAMLVTRYKFYFTGLEAMLALLALGRWGLSRLGAAVAAGALVFLAALHPLTLTVLVILFLAYLSARLYGARGPRPTLGLVLIPAATLAALLAASRLPGLLGAGPASLFVMMKTAAAARLAGEASTLLASAALAGIPGAVGYLWLRTRSPRLSLMVLMALSMLGLAGLLLSGSAYPLYASSALGTPWKLDPPPVIVASAYAAALLAALALRLVAGPVRLPGPAAKLALTLGMAFPLMVAAEYLYASYHVVRITQLAVLPLALYVAVALGGLEKRMRGSRGILIALMVLVFALHPTVILAAKASKSPGYSMETYLALADPSLRDACMVTYSVVAPGIKVSKKVLPLIATTDQAAYPEILEGYCNRTHIVAEAGRGGLGGLPAYLEAQGLARRVAGSFYEVEWPSTAPCSETRLVERPGPDLYNRLIEAWRRGDTPTLVAPWDDAAPCTAGPRRGGAPILASSIAIRAEELVVRGDSIHWLNGSPRQEPRVVLRDAEVVVRPANYTYYAVVYRGSMGIVVRNPVIEARGYEATLTSVYLRPLYNAAVNTVIRVEGERLSLRILYTLAPGSPEPYLALRITGLRADTAYSPVKQAYLDSYLAEASEMLLLAVAATLILTPVIVMVRPVKQG